MHVLYCFPKHLIDYLTLVFNTIILTVSPAECGYSEFVVPLLPGRLCRSDGGPGGNGAKGSHAQALSSSYVCHRETMQGHPGISGHGEILCKGEN